MWTWTLITDLDTYKQTIVTKARLFKYIENDYTKKMRTSDEKFLQFSYFCSKYPQSIFFWAEIRKLMYTPVKSGD